MKTIEQKARDVLEDAVSRFRDEVTEQFNAIACESPIETLMLARLMTLSVGYGRANYVNRVWEYGLNEGPGGGPYYEPFDLYIFPQQKIGTYRVDFYLRLAVPTPKGGLVFKDLVVECDGHDFHEKTKKQAARDKSRDRAIQSLGLPVFRFTGSEIYRNDDELLRDIERTIWAFIEQVAASEART